MAEDAAFAINSDRGIDHVKIAGNNGITAYGSVHIDNISMTSWDPANNTVIKQNATGSVPRAYLKRRSQLEVELIRFLNASRARFVPMSE